mmetsp:Transcript_8200/g.14476  ORF Transcript_8200/g.14476 Transcript_8200/m.14476 type:complete len:410 (-) Transcript_8200:120-1349(-)
MEIDLENFEEVWRKFSPFQQSSKVHKNEELFQFTSPRSIEVCRRRGCDAIDVIFRPLETFPDEKSHNAQALDARTSRRSKFHSLGKLPKKEGEGEVCTEVQVLRFERYEIKRRQLLRELRKNRNQLIERDSKMVSDNPSICGGSTMDQSDSSQRHLPLSTKSAGRFRLPEIRVNESDATTNSAVKAQHFDDFSTNEHSAGSMTGSISKGRLRRTYLRKDSYGSLASSFSSDVESVYDEVEDELEDNEWIISQKSRQCIRRELDAYANAHIQTNLGVSRNLQKERDYAMQIALHQKRHEQKHRQLQKHALEKTKKAKAVLTKRSYLEEKEKAKAARLVNKKHGRKTERKGQRHRQHQNPLYTATKVGHQFRPTTSSKLGQHKGTAQQTCHSLPAYDRIASSASQHSRVAV